MSTNLMATILVIDSSPTLSSEWIPVLVDYLTPHALHIGRSYFDFQFRLAVVTYGVSSSRPSPVLSKRWFQTVEKVRNTLLDAPQAAGIGQTDAESISGGMAMLEGLVAALEMFDLLHGSTKSMSENDAPQLMCHVVHIAACPPDASRYPLWNNNSQLDHVTWETLPAEFKQRGIYYSTVFLRPIPRVSDLFFSICPVEEIVAPLFVVRPHHTCLLWAPNRELRDRLRRNYRLPLSQFVGRRSSSHMMPCGQLLVNQEEPDGLKVAIAQSFLANFSVSDVPSYPSLNRHQYLTDIRPSSLIMMSAASFPAQLYGSDSSSMSVSTFEGSSVGSTSVFHDSHMNGVQDTGIALRTGPFGTTLTGYPSRVITQLRSLQGADSALLGGSSWHGDLTLAESDPVIGARKCLTVSVYGINVSGNRDLRSHSWPKQIRLSPSLDERLSETEFQSWIKKYDPVWCQFVPSPRAGMDIVFQQLVDRLTDQNLYAFAYWNPPGGGHGICNYVILLPFGTNGLMGAVFSSVGRCELPKPKVISTEDDATKTPSRDALYRTMFRDHLLNGAGDLSSILSYEVGPGGSLLTDRF